MRMMRPRSGRKSFLALLLSISITFSTFSAMNILPSEAQVSSQTNSLPASELLVPSTQLSRTFTYPILSFMGENQANLTQTITWYQNGTTALSDSAGNNFSFDIPVLNGTVTLLQNSTVVDQKVVGPSVAYDIYWQHIKNQNGYVDKYKFDIVGTSVNGSEIKFRVNTPDNFVTDGNKLLATKSVSNIVSHGASSSKLLDTRDISSNSISGIGLDWSDAISEGYNMHFNASSSSIDVTIGKSFLIDPTTVDTTNNSVSPALNDYYEGERRIIVAGSAIFVFYYDGSNIVYKVSSDNGQTWGAKTSAGTGQISADYYRWSAVTTAVSGTNYVDLLYWDTGVGTKTFYSERGTVSGTSISWSTPTSIFTATDNCGGNVCATSYSATDTSGNIFAAFRYLPGSVAGFTYRIMKSTDGGLSYSNSLSEVNPPVSTSFRFPIVLAPLSSGKMLFAYAKYEAGGFTYRVYDGTSWGSEVLTSQGVMTTNTIKQISATSNSTQFPYIAYLAKGKSGDLKVARWNNLGSLLTSAEIVNTSLNHTLPAIFSTSDGRIHIYTLNSSKIYETVKTGTTWGSPSNPFGTSFTSPNQLTSAAYNQSALWVEGTSNPLNIKFATGSNVISAGTVDPFVVDPRLGPTGDQRVSYFDGTRNWAFYYNATSGNIVYRSSADNGTTWSMPGSTSSGSLPANSYFGVFGLGNSLWISYSNTTYAVTKNGTISGSSISWSSTPKPVLKLSGANEGQNYTASFAKTGSNLFLAFNVVTTNGLNWGKIYKSGNNGTATWANSATFHVNQTTLTPIEVTGYGKNALGIIAKSGFSEFQYRIWYFTNSSWGSTVTTSGAGLTFGVTKTNSFSVTSNGTCSWVGYVANDTGGPLQSMRFCGSPTFISTPITGKNLSPSISAIGNDIHLLYLRNNVLYRTINSANQTGYLSWGPEQSFFGTSFSNMAYPHAEKSGYAGSHIPVVWREGSTSPYAVKFGITTVILDPGLGCGARNWGVRGEKWPINANSTFGFATDCASHAGPYQIGTGSSARWNYLDVRTSNIGNTTGSKAYWESGMQGMNPFGECDGGNPPPSGCGSPKGALYHNYNFPLSPNLARTLSVQYLWFKNSYSHPVGTSDNIRANLLTDFWFQDASKNHVVVIDFLWNELVNDLSGNWKQKTGLTNGGTYYTPYCHKNVNNATQWEYHYNVVVDTGGSLDNTWYAPSSVNIVNNVTKAFNANSYNSTGVCPYISGSSFNLVDIEQGAEISPQTSTPGTGVIKAAFSKANLN